MKRMKYRIIAMILVCIMLLGSTLCASASGNLDNSDTVAETIEIETLDLVTGETSTEILNTFPEDTPFSETSGAYGTIPEPRVIIGSDDRTIIENTKRVPYRYIGRLEVRFTTGTTMNVGTAFLVGKSTILTAAHCFFDGNKKVSGVTFIPGKNGSSNPYGSYASTKLHIPTKYKEAYAANHEDEKWKYDYALVELSGTPGAKLGYFALGGYNTQYSIEKLVGEKAIVIGYPTTKMHRHKSDIIGYNSEKYQIYYTTDTSVLYH